MGTRYAVVKGVTSAHLSAMKTHVTNNSGTFLKYDTVGKDFDAEFPTNTDGAQFATDVSGWYTDIHWDVYPYFRNTGQMH